MGPISEPSTVWAHLPHPKKMFGFQRKIGLRLRSGMDPPCPGEFVFIEIYHDKTYTEKKGRVDV